MCTRLEILEVREPYPVIDPLIFFENCKIRINGLLNMHKLVFTNVNKTQNEKN